MLNQNYGKFTYVAFAESTDRLKELHYQIQTTLVYKKKS